VDMKARGEGRVERNALRANSLPGYIGKLY
jgi:hypothetical protein